MHYVYILKSESLDTYYIGETINLENRLLWHNSHHFENAYTKVATDWKIVHTMTCSDIIQARKIEKHIKAMKSKTYILNLTRYPEMTIKLIQKYA